MTIKGKLFSCLTLLAITIAALVAAAFTGQRQSEAAIQTVLADRVMPLTAYATTIFQSAKEPIWSAKTAKP